MSGTSGAGRYRVLPEPIPLSETTTGQDVSAAGRAAALAAATGLWAPGVPTGADGATGTDGD